MNNQKANNYMMRLMRTQFNWKEPILNLVEELSYN